MQTTATCCIQKKKKKTEHSTHQEEKLVYIDVSIITSATEGEGGYVFTRFCLFVCLSVYSISQNVVDGFG